MNNTIAFIFSVFLSFGIFAQINGDIVQSERKLIKQSNFVIEGHVTGKVVFAISVDAKGEITSIKAIDKESTIKSTPAKIKARNYVKENFQFEPGTWFPKYHQGKITITLVEPKG